MIFIFPQMIKILIFVIFLILLISFLIYLIIKYNDKSFNQFLLRDFRGGDGISVVRYDKCSEPNLEIIKQTLSFAEIVVNKYADKITDDMKILFGNDVERMIELSAIEYKKIGYFKYKYMNGYITNHIEPKFFSDSLLDGINLTKIPNIKYVFCKNEFQSSKLFNTINNSNLKEGFVEDRSTQVAYHIHHHSVQGIDNYGMVSVKNVDGTNKDTFIPVDLLKGSNIYVFIEFSYPGTMEKHLVIDMYSKIHRKTLQIMKMIIDNVEKSKNINQIYVIRILTSKIDDNVLPFTIYNYDDNLSVFTIMQDFNPTTGITKFNTINIPSTKDSFAMDEFLFVKSNSVKTTNEINYFVQIEHSEGMERHKSNIVEFILRTCKVLGINNRLCKNILVDNLHYGLDRNGKFIIKTKSSDLPNKDTTVFRFANEEFFMDELEELL